MISWSKVANKSHQDSGKVVVPEGFKVPSYIPAFDGIRALAVLWVMAYHFLSITLAADDAAPRTALKRLFHNLHDDGWVGVPLFFALSGFLITGILYDSVQDPAFFRNFYARRTLRIFPLYYGVLLVLLVLTPFLHLHWGAHAWAFPLYLQGTVPVQFVIGHHINLTHLWSLAVEEQFYLVWPLVCFLLRDVRRLIPFALLFSFLSLGFRIFLVHTHGPAAGPLRYYLPAELDPLLLGAAGALLLRTGLAFSALRLGPFILALGAAPILFGVARHGGFITFEHSSAIFTFGLFSMAVASAGLLLWAANPGAIAARGFSWPPLRLIGRYSYGIYVLHHIIMYLAVPIRGRLYAAGLSFSYANLAAALIMSAISIALAALSFHIYEEPILRLKRYFIYRVQPGFQSPALDDPPAKREVTKHPPETHVPV